jgi:hypothetical protein
VFGKKLIAAALDTFEAAYKLHERGQSEQALLITFDIYAAGDSYAPEIAAMHRAAIKSAVEACDKQIPLLLAGYWLERRLADRMEKTINEENQT